MKTMKKAISLLLCCTLLAAFAPAVHAEEDVLIKETSFVYHGKRRFFLHLGQK